MTICFTLPYSSGGGEERRIKSDLVTAIIKCSLLASIRACRLMLTWLTLALFILSFGLSLFPMCAHAALNACECLTAVWLWKCGLTYCLLSALHAH